jgi:5-formyltetrahydrofolate cyclo-ligase
VAETADSKSDMRARARAARTALSADARRGASEAVADRALALPEVARARSVLAYAALPEEIDPAPLVSALRARGARIALPRVCGPGTLSLHWVEEGADLAPGTMGIPEPDEACAWAGPHDFDLVVVPGVAFDASCARLGFGGGFYDAFLPILPKTAVTVALAFDEQLVDVVPCEAHDTRVDAVVTPSRVHRRTDRSASAD